jgi:carbon storage regulator
MEMKIDGIIKCVNIWPDVFPDFTNVVNGEFLISRKGFLPGKVAMLVLSRQRDETIMIGDDIEVTVVDIRGDKVRLGITAPKEISVHRKEVYDAIRRENRAAAQVKPEDLSGLGKKEDKK